MFVPDQYREPEATWMAELVRENPLAQLSSNGDEGAAPYATHVPVILDPQLRDLPSELPGVTLWGHMNRANPQWAALASPTPVVVAFSGPHSYVSPTVYGTTPAAPTWNFTAVHIRGLLSRVDSEEDTLETVKATVRALEGRFGAGWDMSESVDYFRRILPGVGAFRIAVSQADGMFKLSQEQESGTRERVRCSFAGETSRNQREIAAMMGRLPSVPARVPSPGQP
ncbi:FMN-binding negative transcriptional regulator [Streptomyces sp. NPDC059256]|uniref:FMN-binding negative transcriptional regulator n=1 Tax=Streptomyces sp. NPDC059256 TaxID=3346794 RepID=UPI0036A13602